MGVVGPRWLVVGLRGPTLGLLMAFGWGGGTLRVVEENSTPGSRLREESVVDEKKWPKRRKTVVWARFMGVAARRWCVDAGVCVVA